MTDAQFVVDLVIVVTRAIILLGCLGAAILSIVLGAKMYQVGVSEKSSAELQGMGIKLVIKSAGPGLLLIAFGIVLLLSLVARNVVMEDSEARTSKSAVYRELAPPGPLAVADTKDGKDAKEAKAADKVCVLSTRKRVFSGGGNNDLLSSTSLHKSAESAADGLSRAGEQGIADKIQRANVIKVLKEISSAARENGDAT